MAKQIKKLVDQGQILNYDACFLDSAVTKLAKEQPVDNDDLNMSMSKDRLCRMYFNNSFWRGGINSSIDDRIRTASKSGWDTTAQKTSRNIVEVSQTDFNNNLNRLTQSIVSMHMYGNTNDANNVADSKARIESNLNKIHAESAKLDTALEVLNRENSDEMLQQVADTEGKMRQIEMENNKFRLGNELRREQAKDLYTRFDSNFHSSAFGYFGYNPMHPSSQPALVFTSFFMGFIGLVIVGIQVVPLALKYIGSSTSSPMLPGLGIKKPSGSMF
jgi:hypothetical protein